MTARAEDRIVGLAIARGLVSLEDAIRCRHGETGGPVAGDQGGAGWVASLVSRGLLTPAAVEELERELSSVAAPTVIPLPSAPPEAPLATRPRLGDYVLGNVIGRGGMGTIVKAFEPALRRHVAIKFLRGDDPELAERFVREAQLQARVEHEHVCRVFEVGIDADGRHFIVMQYIDGVTLREAAADLSLDQKLRLLRSVAQAVHAAHRLGLIHRDLKPGNIMVERTADGELRPFVLDFGLAQDQQSPGMTRTGAVMGTPAYMAPEQALGDRRAIDRRTDVWALGAVLFELLVGRTPFVGESDMSTLLAVINQEPPAVRTLAPDVPADVETIVMKCLEREPGRRYDSARALGEDIGRYLDGEPIAARRATWGYVAARKLRKHRALAVVSAIALVSLVVLGGVALGARLRAQEQAALAQEFGRRLESGEGLLRYASALPLHDTRREREILRQDMKAIRAALEDRGAVAVGPARSALGRGHLALGEDERGLEELRRAWQVGYRPPEVRYALGLALGRLYERARADALRITSPELRAAHLAQLARSYRDPALEYLQGARGTPAGDPAFVEALVALFEERFDEALAKADEAARARPWLYEPVVLRGDVLVARGDALRDRGELDAALAEYRAAGDAFAAAGEMGRSDPAVHERQCLQALRLVEIEVARGGSPTPGLEAARAAVTRALAANPDSATAHMRRAVLFQREADALMRRGADVSAALVEMESSARQAIELQPGLADGHQLVGLAHLFRAMFVTMRSGGDPEPDLERAMLSLDRALGVDPGHVPALVNRATVFSVRTEHLLARGRDPQASVAAALADYDRALAVAPGLAAIHHNIGNLAFRLGEWQQAHGTDPTAALERSIAAARRAGELNPAVPQPANVEGGAHEALARWEAAHGRDPRAELDAALACYARSLERNPSYAFALSNECLACLLRAEWDWRTGAEPRPWLDRAEQACRRAIAINPKGMDEFHNNLAGVELLRARVAFAAGRDPHPALDAARLASAEALAINPRAGATLRRRAEIELLLVRHLARQGLPTPVAEAEVRGPITAALEGNPKDAAARLVLAELDLIRAEALLGSAASEALVAGLEHARHARAVNDNAAARALEGRLLLLAARRERPVASERARAAAEALTAALAVDGSRRRELEPLLREAQQLSGGEGASRR